MASKVKVKLDKKLTERIRKKFQQKLEGILENEIVEKSIKKGISPVKGQRKFQQYSENYKDSIRRGRVEGKRKISPVTMQQTGTMLKSFYVKPTKKGVRVGFLDPLAVIHNDLGTRFGKVIRRLLPTNPQESFNVSIFRNLRRTLQDIIKKETR